MNLVFFGTHTFAAVILERLLADTDFSIRLVVTQPDKPAGRAHISAHSPVKQFAIEKKLAVAQPESLKHFHFPTIDIDLAVVAQYGVLIPAYLLDLPRFGTLNVHTSLLPKYCGASPIQSALRNGDTKTGVTIMRMDEGLDTGPILLQKKIDIGPDDTYLDLDRKLARLGADALLDAIPAYTSGQLQLRAQDTTQATYCKQLTRDDGRIDWKSSAAAIYNQYRALTPWPGVWTEWQGKRLKLISLRPKAANECDVIAMGPGHAHVREQELFIETGDGVLQILYLQLEGKKQMDAKTFLVGYRHIQGETLGS